MKHFIRKEEVNLSLLTVKEKESLDSIRELKMNGVESAYLQRNEELMQMEENLYDELAKTEGFDGYSTGAYNYEEQYKKRLHGETDAETNRRMDAFDKNKCFSSDYAGLLGMTKLNQKKREENKAWVEQLYLNQALTLIRHRLDKKKGILSPKEWNKLSPEEQQSMNYVMTYVINIKGKDIMVDDGIGYQLLHILNAGVVSESSCSGMFKDHPYRRYPEDDKYGRWKKGESMYQSKEKCEAYISFPIEKNDAELLEHFGSIADKSGWTVEIEKMDDMESYVFRLPHTLDGTSYRQVMKEADYMQEEILAYYGGDAEEALMDAVKEVESRHGGKIAYTDDMLKYRWQELDNQIIECKNSHDKALLQKNIEEGKAVKLYYYDSSKVGMTAEELATVFARSGIRLKTDSVPEKVISTKSSFGLSGHPHFWVQRGEARLMGKDEPFPVHTLLEKRSSLSYLMATQLNSTVHGSDQRDRITVMVHPEPMTPEVREEFTVTRPVPIHSYDNYMYNEGDLNVLLSNYFKDDLYLAAKHAAAQKKEVLKQEQTVEDGVTDERIRKSLDDRYYISCRIDGEKQVSRPLSMSDTEHYKNTLTNRGDVDRLSRVLARKYFKQEIEVSNVLKGSQGMKR